MSLLAVASLVNALAQSAPSRIQPNRAAPPSPNPEVIGPSTNSTLQNAQGGNLLAEALPSGGQSGRGPGSAGATPQTPTYMRDVLPIFMSRCSRCHNEQGPLLYDWLNYQTAYEHRHQIARRVWDSWKGTYYKEPMPVPNSPESIGITPQERLEIRRWIQAGAPRGVPPPPRGAVVKAERIGTGRRLFYSICAACHQPTGLGIPNEFPPLAHSDYLNANKERAIRTVLNGRQGVIIVNGQSFNNSMPKFPLSDEDIADVLTFVYNSFGNSGIEVTPEEVARLRQQPPKAQGQVPSAPEPKSEFE